METDLTIGENEKGTAVHKVTYRDQAIVVARVVLGTRELAMILPSAKLLDHELDLSHLTEVTFSGIELQ